MSNQFTLLKERRFLPFFLTQFLGAFNDNVFKTALITLTAFHAASLTNMDGSLLATLLPGVFILPFFLFSASAGQIADKFEKSTTIRMVKVLEIWIMLTAGIGFFLHHFWLLVTALLLMGMHSALFGPLKYAYLPQHLKQQELVGGNGMIEMGTFVAILLGQILGAWLVTLRHYEFIASTSLIAISFLGYFSSKSIPYSAAADPQLRINWNPLTATYRNLKQTCEQPAIYLAIVAISWFWFYGATLLAQFPNFAKKVLYGDESVFILMLIVFSLGVGIGSLLCEKLSKEKIESGLVIFGAIGLSLFGADLYYCASNLHNTLNNKVFFDSLSFIVSQYDAHGHLIWTHWHLLADIACIGMFGGFYIVPLYAFIQTHARKSHQSRVIAANNIMNALFMVVSAGFSVLMFNQGYSIPQLFLATAILNAVMMVYLCIRQPRYLEAFLIWTKIAKEKSG